MRLYSRLPRSLRDDRSALDFYGQFVGKGDLVFDVGANVGIKTKHFLGLGANVICVEPLDEAFERLDFVFGRDRAVTLIKVAVTSEPGKVELYPCLDEPGLSSVSAEFIELSRHAEGRQWGSPRTVDARSLDNLIVEFGEPAYIKLDIEGGEPEALRGLTHAVPTVSFEFHSELWGKLEQCLAELLRIAPYRFNFVLGDRLVYELSGWIDGESLVHRLGAKPRLQGEVFGRLQPV